MTDKTTTDRVEDPEEFYRALTLYQRTKIIPRLAPWMSYCFTILRGWRCIECGGYVVGVEVYDVKRPDLIYREEPLGCANRSCQNFWKKQLVKELPGLERLYALLEE